MRLLRRLYGAGLNSTTTASILPCVDTPSRAVMALTLEILRREHARLGRQTTDLATTRGRLSHLIEAADHHREQTGAAPSAVLMIGDHGRVGLLDHRIRDSSAGCRAHVPKLVIKPRTQEDPRT